MNVGVPYSLQINVWGILMEVLVSLFKRSKIVKWLNFRFRQAGDMHWTCLRRRNLVYTDWTVCSLKCFRSAGSFCTRFWSYLAQNKAVCWVRLNIKMDESQRFQIIGQVTGHKSRGIPSVTSLCSSLYSWTQCEQLDGAEDACMPQTLMGLN